MADEGIVGIYNDDGCYHGVGLLFGVSYGESFTFGGKLGVSCGESSPLVESLA
jgi:hypothetical protein